MSVMSAVNRTVGLLVVVLLLSGCSLSFEVLSRENPMPDAGQSKAIREQILQQTISMKLHGTEISPVGVNSAQSGPEDWTVCVRDNPPAGGQRYYMFFVRGAKVIEGRTPVINDRCEVREYQPLQ